MRLPEEFRNSPSSDRGDPDPHRRTARSCPSRSVATIELDEGYTFVRREQLQRYAVMQMDVQGRDVDGFVRGGERARSRPR